MERMENGPPPPKPSRLSMGNMIDDSSAPPVLPQKRKQHTGAEPAEQKPTNAVSSENESFSMVARFKSDRLYREISLKSLNAHQRQLWPFRFAYLTEKRPLSYPVEK